MATVLATTIILVQSVSDFIFVASIMTVTRDVAQKHLGCVWFYDFREFSIDVMYILRILGFNNRDGIISDV